jgi:hypothetical protein
VEDGRTLSGASCLGPLTSPLSDSGKSPIPGSSAGSGARRHCGGHRAKSHRGAGWCHCHSTAPRGCRSGLHT